MTDESDGYDIPGVKVVIKGSSLGTISVLDDNCSLKARKNNILVQGSKQITSKYKIAGGKLCL